MCEETFTPDWLALREPVDHRSRAADLVIPLAEWWESRSSRRVLDLGSGTGSNLRYLAPRLPGEQAWTLVDRDAALLKQATHTIVGVCGIAAGGNGAECVVGELDREGLELVLGADLVTASALLDLVTHEWLEQLVAACLAAGSGALLSLTWDGTMRWDDPDPHDALVAEAVRSHQLQDKGMGSALGPAGGPTAEHAFRTAGYDTRLRPSPWRLGAADTSLARALIDGWEAAASEQRPDDAALIQSWADRRRATTALTPGLDVGHVDLLALPRGLDSP
jgi:SAM-dependent methyltransferase